MFNPVTYRGYYYDPDLKLYYLQSRYYNPEWGRFLSADDVESISGTFADINVYSYAGNNPIMYIDPDGCKPFAGLAVFFKGIGTYAGVFLESLAAGFFPLFPTISGKLYDASFSYKDFEISDTVATAIELAVALAAGLAVEALLSTAFGISFVAGVVAALAKVGIGEVAARTLASTFLGFLIEKATIFSNVTGGKYRLSVGVFCDENQQNHQVTNKYVYILRGPMASSLRARIID